MTESNLLQLPTELIHRIFDHCDIQVLLFSIRPVCRHLYYCINSYDRFQVEFNLNSKCHFRVIHSLVHPESVTSMVYWENYSFMNGFNLFQTIFDIRQFSRLHLLSLHSTSEKQLEYFAQNVMSQSLTSFSLHPSLDSPTEVPSNISLMINKYQLTTLRLCNMNYTSQSITWPTGYRLEHFTIGTCTFNDYVAILHHLPHLRTFQMNDCNIEDGSESIVSKSTSITIEARLESLAIMQYNLSAKQLELILSVTPSILHLKLANEQKRDFSAVCDGSYWENLITTRLPSLKKLEFFFNIDAKKDTILNLHELITPFQTPFWLVSRRWFINCAYVPKLESIWLYMTTSIITDYGNLVRCEFSSNDPVYHFTRRPVHKEIDANEDKIPITLSLAYKSIGDRGTQYLAKFLREDKALTSLNLGNNQITAIGTQYLAEALRLNQGLITLLLSANQMYGRGAQHIADALRNNKTLMTLYLDRNQIDDIGAQHLGEALQQNITLTSLNLCQNQIGDIGAEHLAEALRKNKTLVVLNIGQNQIGDIGVQHLAEALQQNKTLASFDLQQNNIGESGAQHIAKALQQNKALTSLDLGENKIGDIGAEHLAESLRQNKILTLLDLQQNKIDNRGGQLLVKSLAHNKTLQKLFMGCNNISSTEWIEMKKVDNRIDS